MNTFPSGNPQKSLPGKVIQLFLTCLVFLFGTASLLGSQVNIYVSPTGDDKADGTLTKPVHTFSRAKELVRLAKPVTEGDINVFLREGTYFIDQTIVFGLEDGGKDGQTITWAAWPGEKPVISSGLKLTGWKKSGNLSGLPSEARGNVYETDFPVGMEIPRVMFEGDRMLHRSRSRGFKSRIDAFGRDGQGDKRSFNVMYVNERAELKNWDNPEDMELVIRPWCLWTMNNLPVKSINTSERSITTRANGSYYLTDERYNRFPEEHAWLENLLEGMTRPGSWAINKKRGKVYYWPLDGQPGEDVLIPLMQEFIRVEGYNDILGSGDIPVRNMVFRGITFMHNDRYIFTNEDSGIQHDWELFDSDNAFFRFRGAENCILEECEFTSGGGVAIRLDLYCQNITVRNNYIHDIGGTGIFLGGYGLGTKDVNKKNLITNNRVRNTGILWWHSPGMAITQSGENLISHNEISHTPYSGLVLTGYRHEFLHESRKEFLQEGGELKQFNWHGPNPDWLTGVWIRENARSIRWDEIGTPMRRPGGSPGNQLEYQPWFNIIASFFNMNHNRQNIVEYNEIYDVMKVLGDGNGIYLSDTGPFNVVRYNFVHSSPKAHGAGIRTDAFQMNTMIKGNIVWKFTGGIATRANNMAFNNIVAVYPDHEQEEDPGRRLDFYFDYRSSTSTFPDGYVMRNLIWHIGKQPPYFRLNIEEGEKPRNVVDHNFYFWKDHMDQMGDLLSRMQDLGMDKNGMLVDPMFADPLNGDFTIHPFSPLLRNGFVAIDQEKMGLTGDFPARFRRGE